jgi:hypothetical protein
MMSDRSASKSKPDASKVIELTGPALAHVAGGLNPQPLPPKAPTFRD